ncbi:hypothetical protein [Paracoccus aestuariivivens]|uniref:Uncharacterized protein n=1 Tax=Paracoccus aestuariivivens TaxID=1820333 RepID=A0A6L6J2L0_9RHOB|nr:hypothetical protein [Paracoccus aestuariivivens]MTH76312.1 hypothetical protein [Paracoccus aestuariivivens]
MEGADLRDRRDRELVWFGAMLPHLERVIQLPEFLGEKPDRAERAKMFHAEWDRIDRALARHAGQ